MPVPESYRENVRLFGMAKTCRTDQLIDIVGLFRLFGLFGILRTSCTSWEVRKNYFQFRYGTLGMGMRTHTHATKPVELLVILSLKAEQAEQLGACPSNRIFLDEEQVS